MNLNSILNTVTGVVGELQAGVSGYKQSGGAVSSTMPVVISPAPAVPKPAVDYTSIIVIGFLVVLVVVLVFVRVR